MEVFRDTQVSRWESGPGEPHPVGPTWAVLGCGARTLQPKCSSHVLLLHPMLLFHQLLGETSKAGEQLEGRAKERKSERSLLCGKEAKEWSQNELSQAKHELG